MRASLLTRVADGGLVAVQRLRAVVWPITQASIAAGLAWYITYDVLDHPQPFFAPISAAVCLSATNVLRGRRAAQMIIGVALGIVLGAGVQVVLGTGDVAIGAAVFISLAVAVLIGRGFIAQGLMFINQTTVSAILVLVFARSGGVVAERLFDALIGGGLAIVFSIILFPANPATLLAHVRAAVLAALHDALVELADMLNDLSHVVSDCDMASVGRLNNQLGALIEARSTARLVARRAPRRFAMRHAIRDVDQQAALLGLLGNSVLHLVCSAARPLDDWVLQPLRAAVCDLAAGIAVADADPAAASAHADAARDRACELESAARSRTDVMLANVVKVCADDLQRVVASH